MSAHAQVYTNSAITAAKQDVNFLAGITAPEHFPQDFPKEYLVIWEMLCNAAADTEEKFHHFNIGLPRGFAKTAIVKLWVMWLILFTDKRFILATAANSAKAEAIIADVAMLLSSPNIKLLFGSWTEGLVKNTATQKIFEFGGKTVILAAIGAGGDPRGLNVNMQRPDIIIMDDIQSRECAESKIQSASLRSWMFSTLYYARDPNRGCVYVFIGNMFPGDDCILEQLRLDPVWRSLIVGAILSDGTSLWEAVHPIKGLIQGLKTAISNGTAPMFFAELLNDNSTTALTGFRPERLLDWNPMYEINQPDCTYIIIDPAGRKSTSDTTVIGLFHVYESTPWLIEFKRDILTPKATIMYALTLGMETGCFNILVEDIAYQESLLFWFEEICRTQGIGGFKFYPISRGNKSKNVAIVTMIKQLQGLHSSSYTVVAKPELGLHPKVKQAVIYDIYRFNPDKSNNSDDLLDVLAYASTAYLQHGLEFSRSPLALEASRTSPRLLTDAQTASL